MKKILVPTDFSPNAHKALDFAVQIAKKGKARIILIHACDLLNLTFKDSLGLKKEYNNKIIKDANEKLSLCQESIKKEEKVVIQTKLYKGLVTDTILHAAKMHMPDLIVMGTLGSAGAKERIFGSKTAGVIRKTNVPVFAVPLLSEWTDPSNILLAMNSFIEGKLNVIRPVIELARLFKAQLSVVKFSDTTAVSPHKQMIIDLTGHSYVRKLQSVIKRLRCSFVHLKGHNFEKSIEKYISKNNIDIVTMITHKRSFLKSLLHSSKTKKMSYHSNIPMLALPTQ